jgi:hypothetical protein
MRRFICTSPTPWGLDDRAAQTIRAALVLCAALVLSTSDGFRYLTKFEDRWP